MESDAILLSMYDGRPGGRQRAEADLVELEALVRAAGAGIVGTVLQAREAGEGFGSGKTEEVAELARSTGAGMVITAWELRPSEARALQQRLDLPVYDRTQVILDIFALRAHTREGRLQVEMAQLSYLLPRLVGRGQALSRTGGGIGTRGPGETRLETDRRRIRARLSRLGRELEDLGRERAARRQRRSRGLVPVIALVGYTNVGKSTLFQALTGHATPIRDQVFVTLDPSVRRIFVPGFGLALLVDTVGFVSRLPHHLVEAFRSTLDEVRDADLLLHVVDAASPRRQLEQAAVEGELQRLGVGSTPSLLVENQWDRVAPEQVPEGLPVSARTEWNLDALMAAVAVQLGRTRPLQQVLLPWGEQETLNWIRAEGDVVSLIPRADGAGLALTFRAPSSVVARVERRLAALGQTSVGP